MATQHREDVQIVRDQGLEQRRQVIEDRPSTQRILVHRISRLIWFIVSTIVILVAFRFALMLLAANPANGFTHMVYEVTGIFVAPFIGLVQSPTLAGSTVIDIPSLFAAVVYPLLGWALVELLHIIFADNGSFRRVRTVRRSRDS